jgi:DDHD domain
MADTTKSSFLGSISPWSASRSGTPPPKSPKAAPEPVKGDGLKPSSGLDHSISLRPSPSLKRYPRDCPPLRTRWYYAVDVAKRKPFAPESSPDDKTKPPPAPKKLVPFSTSDSQAIESAFQSLDRGDATLDESQTTSTKVRVNEDYLFDVHIEKRELEPAYWLGPVYEVRRGSWFFQDLTPCDENLANQLEEGYLKLMPWRKSNLAAPRSASQPRSRPASLILDAVATVRDASPAADKLAPTSETPGSSNYRLFGTYMNTTVTYQDSTAAFLSTDDFMSRMSSTVYGRFGGMGGTKVVRGYAEAGKAADAAASKEVKRKSTSNPMSAPGEESPQKAEKSENEQTGPPKRSALERQISSLAGIPGMGDDSDKLAEEEARQQEEQEMEDSREKDGDDQGRKIDHLVLVTHGVGQRLGLRLDSINFIHDVNVLRKTMKAVYGSAPDLQALSILPDNCSIQVLPICWRHLLDFPKQSLKQNRQESDIGDMDESLDDDYPSLQDITVEGVPAVRNLITDLAMDVLLYQSAYREHIASIVQKECNRVYQLFKERTGFNGKVSLCGHSLGSAILFDILCRQSDANEKPSRRRASTKDSTRTVREQKDLKLDFDCDSFFCLGSPIAMFQMLKGRTISGRQPSTTKEIPVSPFDPDPMTNDPFLQALPDKPSSSLIPITTSSPKCGEFYNIFHPTDPIAYRIEPLISPAMAQLKPQPLPYTKKGLFAAPGLSNISARVTQQLTSSWFNLTSGAASMLINRSLGITGEEQALPMDKSKSGAAAQAPSSAVTNPMPISDGQKQQDLADAAKKSPAHENRPTLIDAEIETLYAGFQKGRRSQQSANSDEPSGMEFEMEQEKARKLKREEGKVKALNSNGRVDYSIQEGMFDVSLLASIASHLSYWADEDVVHFMVGQMLKGGLGKGRGRE